MNQRKLVVAISGASGVVLGVRFLEVCKQLNIQTHLIISPSAHLIIKQETQLELEDIYALADIVHKHEDVSAPIASGSYKTMGMVVIPCSIKTLSAIANSYAEDLIVRAADVTIKEGRPLVLVIRETPWHKGHIRLLQLAVDNGAIIFPPIPAFYVEKMDKESILNNIVGRVLARMGIENELYHIWRGSE